MPVLPAAPFWAELSPRAAQTIQEHIGWNKETPDNQAEQGGLLLGMPFEDSRQRRRWVRLEKALPAYGADGSMKHLHFGHRVWHRMLEQVPDQTQVVGWYHTHPKHLRVYLSEVDRKTQETFFYQPWHVALVLNPQQKVMRAFCGKKGKEIPILSPVSVQKSEKKR